MNKRFSLILKGSVFSLILTVMFSLLLALLVYLFDISDSVLATLIFLIATVASMTGAYAICRAIGSKGLATGGGLGIIYYIILAIVAVIIKKELSFDSHALIMLVCSVASGMLGGVLGMPR